MCALYLEAPTLAGRGERVVSTDELTGVQALERLHPGLPLAPGRVVAHAGEAPATSGRPITHWGGREVADEIIRRGIIDRI